MNPLAPNPVEIVVAVAGVVALVFGAYAIRKMVTRQWPLGFGLTLIVLTLVVPCGGPLVLGALRLGRTLRDPSSV